MIEGIPLLDLTAPTLLGLTVILLLLGKLIPRATYQDKADEAARWHKAYEIEREARAASDAQTKELLEVAHLTHAIINSMFSNGSKSQRSGAYDVEEK